MFLRALKLINFRRFLNKEFEFSEKNILFEGINGIGKSSVLEAIYLLCTGKSPRKATRTEMINFNSQHSYIEGDFVLDKSPERVVKIGVGMERNEKNSTSYLIDNTKKEFMEWFGTRPIVSFSPEDIYLIFGSPENRRKFFDIYGSFIDPDYLKILLEYRFWLTRKNTLLRNKIEDSIQYDIYDQKLSDVGTELIFKRWNLIEKLKMEFSRCFEKICNGKGESEIFYETSPYLDINSGKKNCKNVFFNLLCKERRKDLITGFTRIGPHREDIKIFFNGKDSRLYSSQGEGRALSLALKLSVSEIIEQMRGESIIYIIDDTVAELDEERTKLFFSLFKDKKCQIFVSSPTGKFIQNCEIEFKKVKIES
ncbi:MAG: DNA replication and repair protein RecF [Chitinispirillaceae bacterium]|nr:DNA replication and repair protein RecF [Chitinispirillaceae bacterium]